MTQIIYYALHGVGFIVSGIWAWFLAPKINMSRIKALVVLYGSLAMGYASMLTLYWLIKGSWGGQNLVRIFVIMPVIGIISAAFFKVRLTDVFEIMAPAPCICQFFGKIGCSICGCCQSWLECDWGLYNWFYEKRLFPIQPLEGLVAGAIAVFVIFYAKKHNYHTKDRSFFIMMFLFGFTRIFLEYLRDSNKYFLGLSELAFWSVGMVAEALLWLLISKPIWARIDAKEAEKLKKSGSQKGKTKAAKAKAK